MLINTGGLHPRLLDGARRNIDSGSGGGTHWRRLTLQLHSIRAIHTFYTADYCILIGNLSTVRIHTDIRLVD